MPSDPPSQEARRALTLSPNFGYRVSSGEMANNERRIALLQEKAREASAGPGVYRMMDQAGKILYIGKAKSLTSRVRHYFSNSVTDTKTKSLVARIHDFDVILTQSESEALILESILIKRHKPRYNIALKDDKSYPYVVINGNHTYPKLVYMRRPRKTKNQKVYGPFASANSLRAAIRTLNRIFRLRDCTDNEFTNRSRPCINHQIGICTAPCTGLISVEDYNHDVESALQVLAGHAGEAVERLKKEMSEYRWHLLNIAVAAFACDFCFSFLCRPYFLFPVYGGCSFGALSLSSAKVVGVDNAMRIALVSWGLIRERKLGCSRSYFV